jgi:hypothetical protein
MNEQTRESVFSRSEYLCEVCGNHVSKYSTPQIAHRVHKGKTAENYIMSFIWNEFKKDRSRKWVRDNILEVAENLKAVCSLKCNDKVNIFFKPVERDELLRELIESAIKKEEIEYNRKKRLTVIVE